VAQSRHFATPYVILYKASKYVIKIAKIGVWRKLYFLPHFVPLFTPSNKQEHSPIFAKSVFSYYFPLTLLSIPNSNYIDLSTIFTTQKEPAIL